MPTKQKLSPDRIMQFAWGYAPTLAIEAAVRHGMFDTLDKGPLTTAELARKTGASVRGVGAIVDLLVSIQLLQRKGKRVGLTAESSTFLVSTKPGFYGALYRHISDQLLPNWLQLTDIVKTGKPAKRVNHHHDGAEFFANFVESLFPLSFPAATALGKHLGIAKSRGPVSVLDIGAGSGVWGIGLAKQSPHVRIHAVDWPQVLEVTRRVAGKHGLADRLTTAAGDFFDADFGAGHRLATIGHILHSEGRDRSRRLLKKVFDALAPGGTVAVQEFVPDENRSGPPSALIFAVNMLVNTEAGDTFTFKEMSGWMREAGFKNPRLLKVPSVSPLVLADKPSGKR
ncbi:MAG TPA: methyltransferase [Verrucomicrobiae bacterium]|jgi:ubiquinone/menaquinone biosynthesis C-methylase UbiE